MLRVRMSRGHTELADTTPTPPASCFVSLVGGTHYSTEKFALIAMTRFFEGLGLECTFLPETPNFEEL